jgi:translation initiation factor 1 (eIF-1/SUI1)
MTIEERLDRLVERHEAITQTVEHLALQGEEQNKRLQIQGEHIDRIVTLLEKDGDYIRSLARIAEIHARRISDL